MLRKILSPESTNHFLSEILYTGVRVFVGLTMAIAHGFGKLPPPEMMVNSLGEMGFPAPGLMAWCAAIAEVIGGLFLAVGFLTRPAAFFIGFTMLIAGFVIHAADPFQTKELALLYLAISLVFVAKGPGAYSMDAFLFKRK